MTRPRYLAIVSHDPQAGSQAIARLLKERPLGFMGSMHGSAFLLLVPPGQEGPPGVPQTIVGQLFGNGSNLGAPMSQQDWHDIERSHGAALMTRCWGNFVAFLPGNDRTEIVRAPFGDLGCYYVERPGFIALASDVETLVEAGLGRRRIAWEDLARHIARPENRTGTTCLRDIAELQGGCRLTISRSGAETQALWSPWRFASPGTLTIDPDQAALSIATAVQNSVVAIAGAHRKLLLLLSGGLDSSIVAASLARCGADFECLNLLGNDAASDEQRYARAVAETLGRRLYVKSLDLSRTDITMSAAARMPYPVARCFNQASDGLAAELAQEFGAGAVMDGGGGDNMFFASRSVTIPADCLLASGFDQRFWATTRTLGDLSQTSLVRLTIKAGYRAWLRSRRPRSVATLTFLSKTMRDCVPQEDPHPWAKPPPQIWPGRAAHCALLIPAQNLVEAMNGRSRPMSASPLVTQPVVEACLGVASWLWIAPGLDRASARYAYRPHLPQAVLNRRVKGTPNSFVAGLFEQRRQAIRAFLAHGMLAAHGLLDLAALGAILDDSRPVRDFSFARVMELVDAEAWARAQS